MAASMARQPLAAYRVMGPFLSSRRTASSPSSRISPAHQAARLPIAHWQRTFMGTSLERPTPVAPAAWAPFLNSPQAKADHRSRSPPLPEPAALRLGSGLRLA